MAVRYWTLGFAQRAPPFPKAATILLTLSGIFPTRCASKCSTWLPRVTSSRSTAGTPGRERAGRTESALTSCG